MKTNPLYRFAKLGQAEQPASSAASSKSSGGSAGLLEYAKLGVAPAAKKAAAKLSDAAALLKLAKMK